MTTEAKKDEPLFLDTPEPKVTDEGGLDIVLETKPAEKKEPEPKVEDKKEPEVKKDEKSEPKADDKPVFDDPKRQTMFEEGYIDKDGKPGPNHDKFVKLYGEKKDLERQLRDGIDNSPAIQEVKSMLQNLIERNKVLEEQIADSGAESRLGRLDVQLAELESQQATAKDDMDMDKFSSLNDKIVEVKMALRDEEAALKQGDEPAAPANAVAIDAEWATAVVAFKADNPWFDEKSDDYNRIMSSDAINIDNKLRQDPKWANVPFAERLKEVATRMVDDKLANIKPTNDKPPSPEGGATTAAPVGAKTVRLSALEKELADGLGTSYEDFAKAKMLEGDPV